MCCLVTTAKDYTENIYKVHIYSNADGTGRRELSPFIRTNGGRAQLALPLLVKNPLLDNIDMDIYGKWHLCIRILPI